MAKTFSLMQNFIKKSKKQAKQNIFWWVKKTHKYEAFNVCSAANQEGFATSGGWIALGSRYFGDSILGAQAQRTPPIGGKYSVQELNLETLRSLVRVIQQTDPKIQFLVQYHYPRKEGEEKGAKKFHQPNPPTYSAQQLLDNVQHPVFMQILSDPEAILSMKLTATRQIPPTLVIFDLDPESDTTIPHPLERPLLEGLDELMLITNLGGPTPSGPIVIQTPRGLHILFSNNPETRPKIPGSRAVQTRLGLKCELINSGICALIGQNYRLITKVGTEYPLTPLPIPLWPMYGQSEPTVINKLIPIGSRYNTLTNGINSKQFVTDPSGSLIPWLNRFFVEKDSSGVGLTEEEIGYLTKKAAYLFPTTKLKELFGAQTQLQQFPAIRADLMSPDSFVQKTGTYEALIEQLSVNCLSELRKTGYSRNRDLQESVNALLKDAAVQQVFVNLSLIYGFALNQVAFGDVLGFAKATVNFVSSERAKFLVWDNSYKEFLFYDTQLGVWSPLDENVFKIFIRNLVDQLGSPSLQDLQTRGKVEAEVRDRCAVASWGADYPGFSFKNGVKLLGYPNIIPKHQDLQIRTFVDAQISDDGYRLSEISEKYFRNLTANNPCSVHLLRVYLFNILFNIPNPSHFLMMQGPPQTGKSLFFRLLEHLFGKDSVYRADTQNFDLQFSLAGVGSNLKVIVFEDADETSARVPRLLSWIKERCTQNSLKIKRKFDNKEYTISNVAYALVVNSFLPFSIVTEALERRQIILQTRPVEVHKIDKGLFNSLVQDTGNILSWIEGTPHFLTRLLNSSASLNYMAKEEDFSFNPVADFLIKISDELFFTPGASMPIVTLTKEQTNSRTEIVGILGLYEAQETTEKEIRPLDFQKLVSELSRTVFCLPANEEGLYVAREFVPGTPSGVRAVWLNVSYCSKTDKRYKSFVENFEKLTVRCPLDGAVLGLLPFDVNGNESVSSADGYSPGIFITNYYPEEWLRILFRLILEGPEDEIEKRILKLQVEVTELLQVIAKRDILAQETLRKVKIFGPGDGVDFTILDDVIDVTSEDVVPAVKAPPEIPEIIEPQGMVFPEGATNLNIQKTIPVKLNTVTDLYSLLYKLQKGEEGTTPKEEVQTLKEPDFEAKFINKQAFLKLSKVWVEPNKNLNTKSAKGYFLNKNSTWETALAGNNKLKGITPPNERVELVWNSSKTVIIDVAFPEGTEPSQKEIPSPPEPGSEKFPDFIKDENQVSTGSPPEGEVVEVQSPTPPDTVAQEVLMGKDLDNTPETTELRDNLGTEVLREQKIKPVKGTKKQKLSALEKLEKGKIFMNFPRDLKGAKIQEKSVLLDLINKLGETLSNESQYKTIHEGLGPVMELDLYFAKKLEENFFSDFGDESMENLQDKNWMEEKAKKYLNEMVIEPFRSKLKTTNFKNTYDLLLGRQYAWPEPYPQMGTWEPIVLGDPFFDSYLAFYNFFNTFKYYNWGIDDFAKTDLTHPFQNARANEEARERFATWPSISGAPEILNSCFEEHTKTGVIVQAFFSNLLDLVNNNLTFSTKTGSLNRTSYWKQINLKGGLFTTRYQGDSKMDDPGRIAALGSGYTTYSKEIRKFVLHPLMDVFQSVYGVKFLTVDIVGAHSMFQVALLKKEIPLLFKIYKENKAVWEEWQKQSPVENGQPTITVARHKDALKTLFYASLNGGSVYDRNSCLRHLSGKKHGLSASGLNSFVGAFLIHPFTKELEKVRDFWVSLKGEMFVPTRQEKVQRVASEKDAKKRSETTGLTVKAGEPQPHKLPTLYFTSFELIFMTKIYGFLGTYHRQKFKGSSQKAISSGESFKATPGSCWFVQGMHDGVIVLVDESTNIVTMKQELSDFIQSESDKTLGVPLTVTVTPTTGPGG